MCRRDFLEGIATDESDPASASQMADESPISKGAPTLRDSSEVFIVLASTGALEQQLAEAVQDLDLLEHPSQKRLEMKVDKIEQFERLDSNEAGPKQIFNLNKAIRAAALLYCHLLSRSPDEGSTLALSEELKQDLSILGGHFHDDYMETVIWLGYMGGVLASGDLRTWYLNQVKYLEGYSQRDWDQVRSILKKFLWSPDVCEEPCHEFYQDSAAPR